MMLSLKGHHAKSVTGDEWPSTVKFAALVPTRPVFSIGNTKKGPPPAPAMTMATNLILVNFKRAKFLKSELQYVIQITIY